MTRKQALIDLRDKVQAGAAGSMPDHTACYKRDESGVVFALSWNDSASMRAYHGSLDAAKALHEEVLPGWFIRSLVQRGEEVWEVVIWPDFSIVGREDMKAGTSSNPARAWLLAILEALIAQEGGE